MKPKATLKLGLAGLMIVCGASFAAGSDKNYATQLELKNCGVYTIDVIKLQKQPAGDNHWELVKEFYTEGPYLNNGQSFCVDLSGWEEFKPGDKARFRAEIGMGSTKNCDSTNFGESKKGRRKMEMAGTSLNNNGCRSKSYKSTRSASQCKPGGTYHDEGPCS